MPVQLKTVPVGATIWQPDFPLLHWQVMEHLPLLTSVMLIGTTCTATLYNRNLVDVLDDGDLEALAELGNPRAKHAAAG